MLISVCSSVWSKFVQSSQSSSFRVKEQSARSEISRSECNQSIKIRAIQSEPISTSSCLFLISFSVRGVSFSCTFHLNSDCTSQGRGDPSWVTSLLTPASHIFTQHNYPLFYLCQSDTSQIRDRQQTRRLRPSKLLMQSMMSTLRTIKKHYPHNAT